MLHGHLLEDLPLLRVRVGASEGGSLAAVPGRSSGDGVARSRIVSGWAMPYVLS